MWIFLNKLKNYLNSKKITKSILGEKYDDHRC